MRFVDDVFSNQTQSKESVKPPHVVELLASINQDKKAQTLTSNDTMALKSLDSGDDSTANRFLQTAEDH